MKALREIVFGLIGYLGVLSVAMADIHFVAPGQTELKVRFNDANDTEVALTEGTDGKVGLYSVADGVIAAESLDTGTYVARILTSDNVDIGLVPEFHWSINAEVPPDVNATLISGADPATTIRSADPNLLFAGRIQTVNSNSEYVIIGDEVDFTNQFNGALAIVIDEDDGFAPTFAHSFRRVASSSQTNHTVTLATAPDFTPSPNDPIYIYAVPKQLPNATAGSNGGLFVAGTNAATTVNITGDITGNLTGSVDSVSNPASIWNALTSGMSMTGSIGKRIVDNLNAEIGDLPPLSYFEALFDGAPTFAEAMDDQGYTTERAEKIDKLAPSLLVSTTIDDATPTQTTFVLAHGPGNDDSLNGALIIVTNDDDPEDVKKAVGLVKNYDAATKTVTLLADPGVFTFADEDKVDVIAGGTAVPLWLSGP